MLDALYKALDDLPHKAIEVELQHSNEKKPKWYSRTSFSSGATTWGSGGKWTQYLILSNLMP